MGIEINYQGMTSAQRHYAGRLQQLLDYELTRNGRSDYALTIEPRPGEVIDLNVTGPAFRYAPVSNWLDETRWLCARIEDEEVWRVWPGASMLTEGQYDTDTGEPPTPVEHAVMELPEGWTDTGILMALELADIAPDTVLSHSQLARVIEALTECEDAERVALWVTDLQSYSHTLSDAIENAEDWVRREADSFSGHWHNGAEYAEESVTSYETIPDVLDGCIDWDAVWDELRGDVSYTEDGGEIWVYEY